jgi:prepilin-type N-terminal cleavage/methylation domain-containing protein
MNLQTNQKGFTIVELLIVIVVIAILAAISIVAYSGIQNRAKTSTGQQLASQIENKAQAFYTVRSNYPATIAQFGANDVQEAHLEGVTPITTAVTQSTSNNGKVVSYVPCGVTGTAPDQTATGATIGYWNFAANPQQIETKTVGTGC